MVSNLHVKGIKVLRFESLEDYKNKSSSSEVLEIENFNEEDIRILSKENFFHVPNYLTYIRKTGTYEEVLSSLSKNKRKKVKKGENEVKNMNLKLVEESLVSEELYGKWYEIYLKSIDSKEIGIISAKTDWAKKEGKYGDKSGIFILDGDGEMICGIIGKPFPEKRGLPKRFSISFSAIRDEYKSFGINDYLNTIIISYCKKLGFDYITRGKDINLYGKHLSSGIPIFKCSFGYEIWPIEDGGESLIKFNNLDEFKDVIFFLSFGKERLVGNVILNKNLDGALGEKFNFSFLEEFKIFDMKDLIHL